MTIISGIIGDGYVIPSGGSGFTAGGDLTGSSTSQTVVSLTGTAGVVTGPATALTIGTTDATSGYLRVPGTFSIKFHPSNYSLVEIVGGSIPTFGPTAFNTVFQGYAVTVNAATDPLTLKGQGTTVAVLGSDYLQFGSTAAPATTGLIRLPNNQFLYGRNSIDSANHCLLGIDNSNYWTCGNTTAGMQFQMGGNDFILSLGATQAVRSTITTWTMTPNIEFQSSLATAPTISHGDKTANSGTGATFTIHAQNETGTTSTGGSLVLSGGTGTSAYGTAQVQSPLGAGYLAYTFASDADQTLTAAQSANNILIINSGVTGAPRTLTLSRPAADKSLIFVRNNNAQTITIAFASGTGVTVATSTSALITTDGTNAIKIMAGT